MSLVITTNLSSLVAQRNLTNATNALNTSIERMSTGYKINHAADNAAGYSISTNWQTQLSSLDVASENISMGADMLTTLEDTCSLVNTHLQRIRDLTEQAANGTYATSSRDAMKTEIQARLEEISRIQANCEYNGIALLNGHAAIKLQVGIKSDANSQIEVGATLLATINVSGITADNCVGASTAAAQLTVIDNVMKGVNDRVASIGGLQNRLDSASDAVDIQSDNLTASLSTLRDTDISEESSKYVQNQILQQASSTLLAAANQMPSIALNLI